MTEMNAMQRNSMFPLGFGDDVIVEQSNITDKVQIFRKKEIPTEERPKILVAAYCRVSTELEKQQKSLDHQMSSYKKIISEHPGWELADIYADPGVTGTSVKKRKEFLRMIEDAKAGKIHRIIAKSISRFARNTEDALKYTRMLRSIGVGVYFEKEKIDTIRETGRMERYYLKTMVKRITLADWRSVKIVWKSGRQTVMVLNIKEARKHPLPEIEEAGKQETVYGGVVYQNFQIDSVKQGIQRRGDYINSLIIEKIKDDPIPKVRKNKK